MAAVPEGAHLWASGAHGIRGDDFHMEAGVEPAGDVADEGVTHDDGAKNAHALTLAFALVGGDQESGAVRMTFEALDVLNGPLLDGTVGALRVHREGLLIVLFWQGKVSFGLHDLTVAVEAEFGHERLAGVLLHLADESGGHELGVAGESLEADSTDPITHGSNRKEVLDLLHGRVGPKTETVLEIDRPVAAGQSAQREEYSLCRRQIVGDHVTLGDFVSGAGPPRVTADVEARRLQQFGLMAREVSAVSCFSCTGCTIQ